MHENYKSHPSILISVKNVEKFEKNSISKTKNQHMILDQVSVGQKNYRIFK